MGEVQSFSELSEYRKEITEHVVEFLRSALRSRLLGLWSWMKKKYTTELKEIASKSKKKKSSWDKVEEIYQVMSPGFLA